MEHTPNAVDIHESNQLGKPTVGKRAIETSEPYRLNRLKSSTLDLSYAKDVAGGTPAPLRDRGGTVSDSTRRRVHEGASPLKLPLVAAVRHTSHVTYIFGRSSRIYTCPDLMGFLRRD